MPRRSSFPESTFDFALGIHRSSNDDWFDVRLDADTGLFVDPFLMFGADEQPWNRIHDDLIAFFNTALEHVAQSGGVRQSVHGIKAAQMLSFPEPHEFCLGYGKNTIFGSGSGRIVGLSMLEAAEVAINAGIHRIEDFGELMLFGEGFGADRISDMVCNISKRAFVEYTQEIATRHHLPMTKVKVQHSDYDYEHNRWESQKCYLPLNPCWDGDVGVLLVPEAFLDELPTLDDSQFWDWVYNNRNEQLRHDLGYEVTSKLDAHEIIRLAKRRATLRLKYGPQYAKAKRENPPTAYDTARDPSSKTVALRAGQTYSRDLLEVTHPEEQEDFCNFVKSLVEDFKTSVEGRGLTANFWVDSRPRPEPVVQDIFHFSVLHACRAMDIDLSPESDAGRGPVDFKFSQGWQRRALVEMKFAKSTTFGKNAKFQTPTYLKAEDVMCGILLVLQHYDEHCTAEFESQVENLIAEAAENAGKSYVPVFVDVRRKKSASTVGDDEEM